MASTGPPTTTSQPSRKGKKAWRKNVDIAPIESGLEDLRKEQITHGGVLAEKDAGELFVADTVGDEGIVGKVQHSHQPERKLLKAQEILGQRSKVPGVEGRKRKRKTTDGNGASINDVGVMGNKKAKTGSYVPHRTLQHLRSVADGETLSFMQMGAADHDPWAPTISKPTPDFLPQAQANPPKKREPSTLKQPPQPLTSHAQPIPHVSVPDPGKSYNPLVTSYTSLLAREGASAVETEKTRLANAAAEADREARAAAEAAKVEAAEEAAWATDYDDSEWEGFQSEGEGTVWTVKAKGRLTPQERKKVKARKEREAKEVHERKMKGREKEESKIGKIAREVAERSRAGRSRAVAVSAGVDGGEDVQEVRRPRLGKLPVPEAPLELVLPEELEDSLRRLKPEGDLMMDRYRNMLVNGKVEPRKRKGERKQVKTTRSEKWSYKDWKLK